MEGRSLFFWGKGIFLENKNGWEGCNGCFLKFLINKD